MTYDWNMVLLILNKGKLLDGWKRCDKSEILLKLSLVPLGKYPSLSKDMFSIDIEILLPKIALDLFLVREFSSI
jgi:hypothetical protein